MDDSPQHAAFIDFLGPLELHNDLATMQCIEDKQV